MGLNKDNKKQYTIDEETLDLLFEQLKKYVDNRIHDRLEKLGNQLYKLLLNKIRESEFKEKSKEEIKNKILKNFNSEDIKKQTSNDILNGLFESEKINEIEQKRQSIKPKIKSTENNVFDEIISSITEEELNKERNGINPYMQMNEDVMDDLPINMNYKEFMTKVDTYETSK